VRRALALAIDREQLAHAAWGQLATPANAMIRPGTGGYTPPSTVRFDPVEARRLLAEAGYPGGAGLPKIELMLNGNAGRVVTSGEVLQRMWSEHLGVQVSVLPVEFKVYLSASRTRQFQVLFEGWGYAVDDPRDLLQISTTGDPNNDAQWSSAAFDQAFANADATGDTKQRSAAFDAMERLIAAESPYTPLFFANQGLLVHPDVRGWRDNALSQIDWRELYLEAAH
jgi:oligopeptide transport system substrate-binding protein